jgi:DDE superfamily endonuclease
MRTLPKPYSTLTSLFTPCFSERIWKHVLVLVIGALLAPHKRTVTACLRILDLQNVKHFSLRDPDGQNYHRVLNRAIWSSLAVSRTLLVLLVSTFAASGPLIVALDDTIERRWGRKIKARGIYRDPVRSSHSHFVKVSGLRWLCAMLLVPIPWAQRVWALPFLTVLAPSERYYGHSVRRAKKLTDWAWQVLLQVRRWLPHRQIVAVADSSFAVISLLVRAQRLIEPIILITRFRMDAALYEPAPPRQPKQKGAPRKSEDPDLGKRKTAPDFRTTAHRQKNALASHDDPELVWRRETPDRDRFGVCRLVSQRAAARIYPLGLDSRSPREIQTASLIVHGSQYST